MKTILVRLLQLITLALFSWVVTLYLLWPLWGGLAIFFGVIGAYFGIKLARRLWLVSRSRVKLAASEAAGRAQVEKSSAQADLTHKWKNAIATLRRSSLRRFGNPIYALPWYMVIGESGVGKTSAITRSRLGSLNKTGSQFEPIAQTVNCDWWFFNRTVIIDTAGRYVSPKGTPEDQAEWERMLELLAKYRLKEGLNGLVLAVDADQIARGDDQLEQYGHVIRERIDQLIRLFDKRFPIFLLVTKCDRIYGFEQWTQTLPTEALAQAMGYVGALEEGDGAEARFTDQAFDQITTRLRQLRLDMGVKGVDLSAPLLLLPEEIDRLRGGLKRFLAACMGNNPYLEQPLLRGLFLSSARQGGETLPNMLGLIQESGAAQGADKGAFLHDFFERVLPADRWTFRPTVIIDRWRLATRNLAAVFWICTFTAALLFLMLSFYQTRSSLIAIRDAYPMQALVNDQPPEQRLQTLQSMLRLIELIQNHEQNWQTRWLAFSPDLENLEDDIKAAYVRGFRDLLQKNRREDILPVLADEDSPSSTSYAEAVLTLTRNVNMTQARIDGATYDQLLRMPQAPEQLSEVLGLELPPHLIQAPAHMSAAYKAWSDPEDPALLQSLRADRAALAQAVEQSEHFSWLLAWANQQRELKPVTLRTFWLPGSQGQNTGAIAPALTLAGQRHIRGFLNELEQALNNSTGFQFKRGAFEAWYRTERFNSWQSFAWSFDNGELLLANEPAWRDMVTKVDTDTSPYYEFFDRLRSEFAEIPDGDLPGLMLFAREFPALRRAAAEGASVGKAKAILQTINTVGERIVRPSDFPNPSATPSSTIRRSIQGVQAFADYAQQFDVAAAKAMEGNGQSYQLMADYFNLGVSPDATTSALQTAQDSLNAFRKASGFDLPDDQVIWKLIGGPLRILTRYALEQGSCHLQKEWEEKVLWKTQMAVSAQETNDQLFGDKGSVWAFVDGPAKPFILQKATQFTPAQRGDYTFPFADPFLPFLNRSVDTRVEAVVKSQLAESAKGKSATILITARPIGVNDGAKAKPYSVNLSIQCAQQEITLDNFNMSVTNSFDWSPDQCGDVTLRIYIDELTLTQRYPGPMGMARFVAEFKDGERIFTPEDFPQARERLEALNVRTIHVRYDFSGQGQLLSLADNLDYLAGTSTPSISATPARLAFKVPERIGQCWTEGPPEQAASPMPLYIRQRAEKIIAAPPPPPLPPAPAPLPERTHRVKEGDTLYSLSRQYGTDVQVLQQLNHLKNTDLIMKGQILKLPPENNSM
ncbi:type VI secretion protein IcmF/TssM N-terminal domain-containing protein [Castellaniella sp. GW247-6E4]|uniref:type VI secretion protein IcmF/TssM N-terminal domain-containing protein n=1 Tax=Castellaniella sp. GW247-6E4 TaxID=3140380 RepID=UPI003315A196